MTTSLDSLLASHSETMNNVRYVRAPFQRNAGRVIVERIYRIDTTMRVTYVEKRHGPRGLIMWKIGNIINNTHLPGTFTETNVEEYQAFFNEALNNLR